MISVIIVTGSVPLLLLEIILRTIQLKHAIWEQFDYYKQKQNKVLYVNMENMDFLPPTAPASFSSARLTRPMQAT